MTGTTSLGTPYAEPDDELVNFPDLSLSLAQQIDRLAGYGARRLLSMTSPSAIPSGSVTPVTGGLVADSGDTGNALLSYAAGELTAVKACTVDVFAYTAWTTNGTGARALDVSIGGTDYRQTGSAQTPGVAGVALHIPGVSLAAGATIGFKLFQSSGGNLAPTAFRVRVLARPVGP